MEIAIGIDSELLLKFATAVYVAAGLTEPETRLCADTLVQADLWGHQSHPKSLQNLGANGRGGRGKGVLNKAACWRHELAAPGIGLAETPTQILAANMVFFQKKAEKILADMQESMKRGVPAAELQRQLMEACKFKVMANEAAVQLAPYVHSKMPTLVAQSDAATAQYVIRVPNALPDGQG